MTTILNWQNKDDYEYLRDKTADNWTAGWAWEFLRRSKAYHAAWNSFEEIRQKLGQDWRKRQGIAGHFPAKLKGETDGKWYGRASDIGHVARKLTASQLAASEWRLYDLYDPHLVYDKKIIRFEFPEAFPKFFASGKTDGMEEKMSLQLNNIEDLQAEVSHRVEPEILYFAFDTALPLKLQIARLGPLFIKYAEANASIENFKPQQIKWASYLRILDALASDTKLSKTKINELVGKQVAASGDKVKSAYDYKTQALDMANYGYRGLLQRLRYNSGISGK